MSEETSLPPKFKVLVIDDSPTLRQVIKRYLQLMGIKYVIEASNGKEGLKKLRLTKYSIDLIFLDMNMPIMNGDETLRTLKKDENTKHIPTVICSSVTDKMEVIKMLKMGAAGYMAKPVQKEDIKRYVDKCMDKDKSAY